MKISFIVLSIFITVNFFAEESKKMLTFIFEVGSYYNHNYIGYVQQPQIALWIEDDKGDLIDTIYVTEKSAKSHWIGFNVRRPDALPVWSHKRGIKSADGLYMPDKSAPIADSVTGATSKKSFEIKWKMKEKSQNTKYVIYAEINTSFDYNETYKKNLKKNDEYYNDANGQPSIIWSGAIDLKIDNLTNPIDMEMIGIGDVRGNNGNIHKDMKNITTAKDLIKSIKILVKDGI